MRELDIIFEELAQELDITPSLFEVAEKRYQSVGRWLNREGSYLNQLGINVNIFLQGSAKLGTITKPIDDTDVYDIDAVCELVNVSKKTSTQKQVKDTLGKDILAYAISKDMNEEPKNGKRCWTLTYHKEAKFHMDFLPALPDGNSFGLILESRNLIADNKETTLSITDKTSEFYDQLTLNWEVSNPLGYFEWFKGRMKERYNIRKNAIAESYKIDIEDVPDYKIKTSLQKAIQILKRHRDIYFKDNLERRVSSVIISTLAAHAYNGKSSLTETLLDLTKNMEDYIIKTGDEYQITNPVNPMENFADKWNHNNDLAIAFRSWIKLAHQDIIDIINGEDNIFENIEIKDKYIEKFGKKSFNNAFGKSLKKYEEKFRKKSGIIAGTTAISDVSKPYGGDCHN